MLELALVENIQRKDLTPSKKPRPCRPGQQCGYTHEDLAKRLGKSRTSITEALSLNSMPPEVRKVCRLAGITSQSFLLQVVRQGDPQKMLALVEKIAAQGATREQLRKETKKPKPGRPKAFVFNFKPARKAFNLRLSSTRRTRARTKSSRRSRTSSRNSSPSSSTRVPGPVDHLVYIRYIIRP